MKKKIEVVERSRKFGNLYRHINAIYRRLQVADASFLLRYQDLPSLRHSKFLRMPASVVLEKIEINHLCNA